MSESQPAPAIRASWLPVTVAVVLMATSVWMWHAVSIDRRHHVALLTQTAAANVHHQAESRMQTRLSALNRMARRAALPDTYPAEMWEGDANLYLQDFPGLEALDLIGPELNFVAAVPPAHANWHRGGYAHPELKRVYEEARITGQPVLSRGFEPVAGLKALVTVVPIMRGNRFQGAIAAVWREPELMEALLGDVSSEYPVRVRDAEGDLYVRGMVSGGYEVRHAVELPGTTWQAEVWPGAQVLSRPGRWAPEGVLAVGLLMSAMVAVSVYLTQVARQRVRAIAETSRRLEFEVELRRQVESELRRLNRTLRALGECNQLLAHARDEQELLDGVCRILVEQCGYALAWVGYPEQDEAKTVRAVAAAGATTDYVTAGLVTWADVELGRGPTGTAIRTGKAMAIDDATADPHFAPWRERALSKGYHSCVCLPVDIGESLPAGLAIYASTTGVFQGEELKLLTDLAQDLGFGVRMLRMRAERERAEQRVMEQQFYTRSLIEASLDPLVTISREGKITDANRAAEAVTGVTRAQLIASDFSEYFTEPDKARAGYQQVFADGFVQDYPLAIRHASGRLTDVLYNATVFRNQKGEVEGVFAAARDITERKRAEEQVRSASVYARSLLEASLDPLVTISREGKITDLNEATERATGLSRPALIGTDFSSYFTEPDKARFGYERVFADGFVKDYALAIRHCSGQVIDVLYNATVFRNQKGEVEGVFAAARDITERKKAEAEAQRYMQELERSNAELQDFASIASHDLQEPLRKVMAFGEHLREHCGDKLDELGLDFLTRMQNAAQRMSGLIEALLEYSRVTTRAQPFQPVDLVTAIFGVLVDMEQRIAQSRARITFHSLPLVMADPTQVRQLFQNLLANALKFQGPETKPEVNISGHNENGWCHISVRDNGIGFDEKYLDRIFRPFQRLHGRSQYEGSGMGLAICRKVVARHGGTITARSRPGEGSTFLVTLPAARDSALSSQPLALSCAGLANS